MSKNGCFCVKMQKLVEFNDTMAKIPEAQNRLFKNVFVCKSCHTKVRSDPQKR
jgi:DNA replicative helicase MCM subunit Mcm2 (Cdc46/Mcm family)